MQTAHPRTAARAVRRREAATGTWVAVGQTGPWTEVHVYVRSSLRDYVQDRASRSDSTIVDVDFSHDELSDVQHPTG